ncbi:MAG: hypothetical protein ABR577_04945 [Pyrinomonadaceae bacterium]
MPHQISLGELVDLLRLALLALAAVVSALVLADARRQRFPFYAVAGFTLGTLFLPLVLLPLYIAARLLFPRQQRSQAAATARINNGISHLSKRVIPSIRWRYTLPLAYLVVALSLIAFYFYRDYTSADAHLMRAYQARLRRQHEEAISEFRIVLQSEPDNAHTRKLLADELAANEQWRESLAEYRTAEKMGEPDDELPFRIAAALEKLKRPEEAAREYKRFLEGASCAQKQPAAQCDTARVRVQGTLK